MTVGSVRGRCSAVAVLASLCVLAGCAEEVDDNADRLDPGPVVEAVAGPTVATVNGVAIAEPLLQEALRIEGPAARRDQVLARLIALELLAQRALAQGLDVQPELRVTKRQAMVQALLAREIEAGYPPEHVGEDVVRKAYDDFAIDFFVPELVTASHLLVEVPEAQQTPEVLAAALQLAADLRAALLAQGPTTEALERLAQKANLRGFVVRPELHLTFPRRAAPPLLGERPRYPAMVEPFAAAAFALGPDHRVSEPVVTPYGVHVIVFERRTRPSRPAYEVVRETIHDDLLKRIRQRHIGLLLARLQGDAHLEIDEAPVEALADKSHEDNAAAALP